MGRAGVLLARSSSGTDCKIQSFTPTVSCRFCAVVVVVGVSLLYGEFGRSHLWKTVRNSTKLHSVQTCLHPSAKLQFSTD
ncbi:unnamed protein product [Allacma fusca]|uniref:Uncharacterized protein n=1 Tax=Allacma fusca TaxID=39272 RepID=A0A8J2NXZ2_9HEXA|nr:unnamed protein product [Allacma fusca]